MLKKNSTCGNPAASNERVTSRREPLTLSASFSDYGASTFDVKREDITADGEDITTYDVALRFLDPLPLDGEHGTSCLVRLSKADVEKMIYLLTSAIA